MRKIDRLVSGDKPVKCPRCKGRKHILKGNVWIPCTDCRQEVKAAVSESSEELHNAARPLIDFGRRFPTFVRAVLAYRGPSIMTGDQPRLEEAAISAVAKIEEMNISCRLVHLEELVDNAFARERKGILTEKLKRVGLAVVICGDELNNKWNGTCLKNVVLPRRLVRKPTLIATTVDLIAEYGDDAEAMMRQTDGHPEYRLGRI